MVHAPRQSIQSPTQKKKSFLKGNSWCVRVHALPISQWLGVCAQEASQSWGRRRRSWIAPIGQRWSQGLEKSWEIKRVFFTLKGGSFYEVHLFNFLFKNTTFFFSLQLRESRFPFLLFLPSPSSVHLRRRKRRRRKRKEIFFTARFITSPPPPPPPEAIQQTIGRQECSHHHPPPPPPPFNKRKEDLQPLLPLLLWYSFLYALGKGGGGFFSPLPPPPPSPPLSGSERGKEEKTASLSLPPFFSQSGSFRLSTPTGDKFSLAFCGGKNLGCPT